MNALKLSVAIALFGAGFGFLARAQSLTDIGAANPIPGANAIYQLSTHGNTQLTGGGFNYFTGTLTGGVFMMGDPQTPNRAKRFYRVTVP